MSGSTDDKPGGFKQILDKAGDTAGDLAGKTAAVAKRAAGDGVRLGAGAVDSVRQRLDREPERPRRSAVLDGAAVADTSEHAEVKSAVAILGSQSLLADFLSSRQEDETRAEKMERVIESQKVALIEVGVSDLGRAAESVASYIQPLPADEQIAFFVDLYFLDPFAPYSLKTSKQLRREALDRLALFAGAPDGLVERIHETRRAATRAHAKKSLGKVGYVGIGAAVVLGVAGLLAAPLVGTAMGVGAGLSGTAATAHGLAILGGGALAAGGAGMGGGMWVVAGAAAATGLAAGGGGVALYELGSATARGELIKLQITFKLGLLDANRDMAKAQDVITKLVGQADDLRRLLDKERSLNDENSRRIKDLEATLNDIEEAIAWMNREVAAAGG